jgi:ABC-2 type transport system ATP-binding protein
MTDVAVAFDRVEKRYGRTVALRGLSGAIGRGEMFGLIGPDGAGKTTTVRLVCGLIKPDAGTVTVLGRDPVRDHRAITGAVGYLSQRFSLYGDLSIDENLAFFAEIHRVRDYRARRDRLLEITHLTPFRGRLADRLSGGMKQKLALACTLIHEPELLILDEPTTGVDPVSRREFWMLLSEFLSRGITIVMATPYLDEAERCSRVALIHDGQALAIDTPAALRASLPGQVVEILADHPDRAAAFAEGLTHVEDVQAFGERIHVRLSPHAPAEEIDRLRQAFVAAGIQDFTLRPIPTSLEDVFIARIGTATSTTDLERSQSSARPHAT